MFPALTSALPLTLDRSTSSFSSIFYLAPISRYLFASLGLSPEAIAIDERLLGALRSSWSQSHPVVLVITSVSSFVRLKNSNFLYLLSEMSDTRAARLAAQRSSPPPANYIHVAHSPEQVAPILEAPQGADYLPEVTATHVEKEDNVLAYLATKEFYITLFLG
ncbi:uncharacterized protein BO88DRAFT_62842 [Aspergillus vadensis CBS 113365]|uniref:Uncharacterized protein n=1 Tax=Aspergillus vadensis (strain CBS 113365 / IMI 142717 / IBT 24658) TaxID=1448311 RepID=A0A319BZR2_ASPVC|nr:hypothetical protein BO88DRAFT_62842 [Aspergillus vadensis CBS 113365]PYH68658.1 hypothetical protein BO88DRAFT_62842 [Aspergillus vadensis CBS 113365]